MAQKTLKLDLDQMTAAWSQLSNIVFVPETEAEYEKLMEVLDFLIEKVGEDESHPLFSMMDVLSVILEDYEAEPEFDD